MDTKKVLTGTIVGGLVSYGVGFVLWGLLLAGFFEGQMTSAVARDAQVLWAALLGNFTIAMLITLAIGWTDSASVVGGLKTGALVGFLVWFGVDLIVFANWEFSTLTGAIADAMTELVRNGVVGAAIGAVLGMGGRSEEAPAPGM